jgi:hypothetical protein
VTAPADEWHSFAEAFDRFSRHIAKARTVNINAKALQDEARAIAQQYFRKGRTSISEVGLEEELSVLDGAVQTILELSGAHNAAASYKKQIGIVRKILPKVTARLELNYGLGTKSSNATSDDSRIIETLDGLAPSAAQSFKQAIIDLADDDRLSFRGPALELREALRETLDTIAPDDDVTGADGYVPEKDQHGKPRSGPTMKQKVRFILKARGQSKSSSQVAEQSTTTVEEMVATLTRSIYDKSAVAAHVASERKTVDQIRRYIVAVLHEILAL